MAGGHHAGAESDQDDAPARPIRCGVIGRHQSEVHARPVTRAVLRYAGRPWNRLPSQGTNMPWNEMPVATFMHGFLIHVLLGPQQVCVIAKPNSPARVPFTPIPRSRKAFSGRKLVA
jgi:hypothetical protein